MNTEQEILNAATELFLEKGYAATSTTDIAKRAGCNQALVHYYYRTKENLFRQIFVRNVENILNILDKPIPQGMDLKETITYYINLYYNYIKETPRTPFLIVNELIINQERREFVRETFMKNVRRQLMYYNLDQVLKRAIAEGKVAQIETLDLLIDIAALTITSFLIAPIYADLLQRDEQAQREFIEQRRKETITTILARIVPA